MSHDITIREDGFAEAAFALTPAWHGLGQVFKSAMTSGEAIEAAGLNWAVKQEPLFRKTESVLGDKFNEVQNLQLNVREDNGFELGTVSDAYKVVQNSEAFAFMDALVENHSIRYESAFSLSGGKWVVMLAQMPGAREITKGDHLLDYIMLSMTHDGTGAIHFGPTSVRVVCANTHALAIQRKEVKKLSISHKGDIKEKLAHARHILNMASEKMENHAEVAKQLANHKITGAEWEKFLDIMCPIPDKLDPDFTDRRANKIIETRLSIQDCYRNERQATAPNTAWAAYNAITEHIDHLPRRGRGVRQAEARFNVTLYGMGMSMKQRALIGACKLAGINISA